MYKRSAKVIDTIEAPSPIGPYSQAILIGGTLYTSGQIAINPKTKELVLDTIYEETHQVMKNLQAVLKAADMDFGHVVKTTIFLSDMSLFTDVNTVYGTFFDEKSAPARETVAVQTLPKNVNVEISMVAFQ